MDKKKKMSVRDMWNYVTFQAKGYRIIQYLLVLGAVSGAAVAYINTFLYARILDDLLDEKYQEAVHWVIVLVVAVLAADLIARACKRMYEHYLNPCEEETKKRTARKAFSMEYEEIEKTETLQKFRRVRQGELGHGGVCTQLRWIYEYFTELIKVVFACGFVGYLLYQSDFEKEGILQIIGSTGLLILAFIGVLWLGRKIAADLGKLDLEMNLENERTNSLSGYVSNLMCAESCAQDIRMYHLGGYLSEKLKVTVRLADTFVWMGRIYGKKDGMVAFALQIVAGIAYIYIVLKTTAGSISVGEVLMYAGAIITMMNSIRTMMKLHMDLTYSHAYLKTYEEFLNLPNMHYDGTLPVEKRNDNEYQLVFEHVSFRYPETEEYIIRDLNLTFTIGEKMALVGRNGAGKTTLIKLLLRLYEPTEGRILLNGIDIGKYDYDEYVSIFSVVFQDFRLYHFPLDENIAGSEDVDEDRVRTVLEQVGMTERVSKMHDGIHTLLYHETGDGEALSGGEAQKVAIARAVYKDAPFVILDEPTAALDPLAEAEIYENFNELVGDKTAIYISHRMSSCKFCDRIVVLDAGEIAETGNHEELIKRQGRYYELYQAQAQHYA